ncbi:hypothetical protein L345_16810 [Ophiophagus hannah]|uniref:Uncharacterized protein n=1 Tax=Ophiophagus hannah TaxID=8665 RepID=V8N5D0_OPHHA|nr:hypothetical protein L345_16810 [Ophiophagus hannah]
MRIKTWHFTIRQYRELVPRSILAMHSCLLVEAVSPVQRTANGSHVAPEQKAGRRQSQQQQHGAAHELEPESTAESNRERDSGAEWSRPDSRAELTRQQS